jgi:hypothetical protein
VKTEDFWVIDDWYCGDIFVILGDFTLVERIFVFELVFGAIARLIGDFYEAVIWGKSFTS